jgi:glycyl-tRNA synthetase alpha chain
LQFSVYNFERADVEKAWQHLALYEAECKTLLEEYSAGVAQLRPVKDDQGSADSVGEQFGATERKRFPVLAAFDLCLKCSHLFNILDARGAISVTERVGVIARIRALAVGVAKAYVDQQTADVSPALAEAAPSDKSHVIAKPSRKKQLAISS